MTNKRPPTVSPVTRCFTILLAGRKTCERAHGAFRRASRGLRSPRCRGRNPYFPPRDRQSDKNLGPDLHCYPPYSLPSYGPPMGPLFYGPEKYVYICIHVSIICIICLLLVLRLIYYLYYVFVDCFGADRLFALFVC